MGLFHEFIWPFHAFVVAHIATGSVGLVAFWLPVLGRKGGLLHRRAGRVFTVSMLLTGSLAIVISLLTVADPVGTHPHIDAAPALLRGVFGWMMLYLAILTINLAWYGWTCVRNQREHARGRTPLNLCLQLLVTAAAANCAVHGVLLGQGLMVGISIVGFATAGTNLWYLYKPRHGPFDWQKEHLKGLVGAGISVYTAFLAFGAVRLVPELALHPGLWSIPLVTGLGIILYHWHVLNRRARQLRPASGTATPA
jgi:hypothetical protein